MVLINWVVHKIDPAEVAIYGGLSPEGPWTEVWKPFIPGWQCAGS
jgi:hypothetical protein